MKSPLIGSSFLASFALAALAAEPPPEAALAEARAIAAEAYVFGVPMVDMYKVIHAYSVDTANPQYKGPFNSILNIARVFTPDDTAFVTPNSDTPYSFACLDLRAEPVVVTVPPIEDGRYFVFQLMDLYTWNFAYIGSRTTGGNGGRFLFTGPNWKGPNPTDMTDVFPCETDLVSIVGRTQMFNAADLENVKKIQAGYKVQTLSQYIGGEAPPPVPQISWIMPLAPGEERTSPGFFNQLAFLLQFAQPPHPSEVQLIERFGKIGIRPGKPFDIPALSPEMKKALALGMEDGQKKIDEKRASLGGKTDMLFGSREFLKNDYVARATGTQVGIGANSRDEALYPMFTKDAEGALLDGEHHKYSLRFDSLPPVNAFWSLTMYNLPEQLLVKNPIDRYLINSPMLPDLKKDADGRLTIYIQAESPGPEKESNWLPAPKGPFMMALRLYWPKEEALNGTWKQPSLRAQP